ncbi:MAG: hypothetical protein ACD_3C00167G0008 [uncultured bacterium (gcode 4)]|uniref:Uncharacterized protein n=1 Tax=uncultured bacterium (gcode 4) TaxID=1234023 RepID=K2GWK4_9BACT|nr:MAG: hypothetical protein ACD_3C00167G0008 [uncultured bacterium (gcode 4)]
MKSQLKVEIIANGKPMNIYSHKRRNFVAAEEKTEFGIRVFNSSAMRILAVISIDGLSIVTGQPTIFDEGGYIISALGNADIRGWRINNEEIASFMFADTPGAYLNRFSIPKPENIGVIEIGLYKEKAFAAPLNLGHDAPAEGADIRLPRKIQGIALSDAMGSSDRNGLVVGFQREDFPVHAIIINYNTAENLRRGGIDIPIVS